MELLCPNCQKKLTVPDQYAGQVMKCPLCAGTFTTPSLPPASDAAYVAPPMPVAPAPVAVTPLPPAGPNLSLPAADVEIMAGPPGRVDIAPVSQPAVPPLVTGDYRHRGTVWLSPRVLPWIAVGALVLVFVLTFFAWVGFYPGGIRVVSQNAWQAAFGSYTMAPEWEKQAPLGKDTKDRIEPGASALLIFFLLFLILSLLVSIAAATLGVVKVNAPPWLQQLRAWWWAIAGAVVMLAFLFLLFQILVGFGLTNKGQERAHKEFDPQIKSAEADNKPVVEMGLEMAVRSFTVTTTLWLAFLLTLLALLCAVLTFWLGRRPGQPLPRLDVMW